MSSVLPTTRSSRNDPLDGEYRKRFISPLMVRIMVVNAVALISFVGGILYLNDFRQSLIDARIETLRAQAEIIAGALGESAVSGPESSTIDLVPARQIISRLVGPASYRVRLFGMEGGLQVDSVFLDNEQRVIADQLPPPNRGPNWWEWLDNIAHGFIDSFLARPAAPEFVEKAGLRAEDLIELSTALAGEQMTMVRRADTTQDVINIAVPIQRFRRVLGALLLTAQTEDIEELVRDEQLRILRLFLFTLLLTGLLSFFLGRTLVSPIRRLAAAAEKVRRNPGRDQNIPKFAARDDEIGDLSRSLSDMTRTLYNQIDAVERFAADVAHELKNPLTSMRSALETLERTDRPDLQARLFEVLQDDVRRLDRLISDISEASRLDAELTRGEKEPLDLAKLINDIVESYKATGPHAEIGFEVTLPQKEYWILGSEARLGQVLRNLIDNALSFSPEKGTIRISMERGERFFRLSVKDDGPGLPDGSTEKIFKRFYSERPETEAFGNHSGLGLAIVKQIIDAHGGRITAQNWMDQDILRGAWFEVRLPIGPQARTRTNRR